MENLRGSLEKIPGRTGTHGSDLLDLDPAAEDVTIRVLIWAAISRSGGHGRRGVRAAAGRRRSSAPRRRPAGVSG